MATEVLIPKLGMTMTEGTVAKWLAADGAQVGKGDPVFRLETEKIEFQVEAEGEGAVRQLFPAGSVLAPGTVVAYILADGEELPEGVTPMAVGVATDAPTAAVSPTDAVTAEPGAPKARGEVKSSPAARRAAKDARVDISSISGSGPGGRVVEADVAAAVASPTPASAAPAQGADPAPASPIARRLAAQMNVDLAGVAGTGPGGRITKEDVEAAAAAPSTAATQTSAPATRAGEVIPIRGMRKVIAERMHASLQEMAQLSMGMEVEMDEASKLRTQLISEWKRAGIRPSFTDLIILAVAKGLHAHPLLNAEITEAGIETRPDIHVGMAVALDNGLVVPVIRDTLSLSLKELAAETSRIAEAAREGTLGPDDYAGGTFSVTSLGAGDVDFFTPIINPPNVAILGVGRIRDGVRWDGDVPVKIQQLTLSLTIDHRAVDGAPGAAFMREVRDLLQAPYRLIV